MAGIVIVDYGMANLRSVQKAFERVGGAAEITATRHAWPRRTRSCCPASAPFRDAIARLRESGLAEPITEHIREGKPFLGICLGLQLLFTRSTKTAFTGPRTVLAGDVVRFPDVPGLKVPHMGWNHLRIAARLPLFDGLPDQSAVYFVHSYYAGAEGPRPDRGRGRLPDAVHLGHLARQRVRDAVPPGEEPGGRAGDAEELRRQSS